MNNTVQKYLRIFWFGIIGGIICGMGGIGCNLGLGKKKFMIIGVTVGDKISIRVCLLDKNAIMVIIVTATNTMMMI
jgi:hypothetical protein